MARTLTLQPPTSDPFDTGWVGKIATAWTGASLQLTLVGSGRRQIQLTRQIVGTTLQLFSQDVSWTSDDVVTIPLGDFTGQLRLTGGLATESDNASIQAQIVCSGDISPWDSSLALDYHEGVPTNPAPGATWFDPSGNIVAGAPVVAPNTLAAYADVLTGKDRRVALWGASQEASCSVTNFQLEKRVTDSVASALHTSGGWWKWFQNYWGCPLTLVYNGGVQAYTTAQTTAKFVADVTTGSKGTTVNTGTGNGTITFTGTKLTLMETITLTFSSATAFTVSGSISGSLGAGTVGTQFGSATTRIQFTANSGGTAWVNGDTCSFQTFMPFTDFDIAVFRFGPNDFPSGTTFAAIKADIDTAITLALNLGKRVHLIVPYLRNPSAVPATEYQNLRAYYRTLVAANSNISMTDQLGWFGDAPIPAQYVPIDGIHANIAGLIYKAPAFKTLAQLAGSYAKPRSAATVGKVIFRFDGSYTFSGNGSLVGSKSQDANGKDRWLVVGTGASDAVWLNFPAGIFVSGKKYKLWVDYEILESVPVTSGSNAYPSASVRDNNSASVFDGFVHGVYNGDQIPVGTRHQGSMVEFLAGSAMAAGGSLRFYPGTVGYKTYLYEVCVLAAD